MTRRTLARLVLVLLGVALLVGAYELTTIGPRIANDPFAPTRFWPVGYWPLGYYPRFTALFAFVLLLAVALTFVIAALLTAVALLWEVAFRQPGDRLGA